MNELKPVKFNEEIVITTKMLADVYGTESKIISNNFKRNEDKFIEGKHYYKLEGKELQAFKGYHQNDESLKFVSVLYLWTKRGASRHCKMLGTDKAWEMFDTLEENYFNPKIPRLDKKQQLQLAILNGDETTKVTALKEYENLITQPLLDKIKEDEPLVTFGERILKEGDNILIRDLAKIASDEGYKTGEKRLYNKLREWDYICKNSTKPTQYAIERDYFILETRTINTPYGTKQTFTSKVTPKGQVHIIERLMKELSIHPKKKLQ